MNKTNVAALFEIDANNADEVFKGFHNPEVDWNGFACPGFPRSEAERIAAWIEAGNERLGVTAEDAITPAWEGDVLVLTDRTCGDPIEERYAPDEDGLYNIGAFAWTWNTLDAPEGADLDEYLAARNEATRKYVEEHNAALRERLRVEAHSHERRN